jgi:hypothetical protein
MYQMSILLGTVLVFLVFVWKYLDESHGHVIRQYTSGKLQSATTPAEYRKLAKKALRQKQYLRAEEYYEQAKLLEQESEKL